MNKQIVLSNTAMSACTCRLQFSTQPQLCRLPCLADSSWCPSSSCRVLSISKTFEHHKTNTTTYIQSMPTFPVWLAAYPPGSESYPKTMAISDLEKLNPIFRKKNIPLFHLVGGWATPLKKTWKSVGFFSNRKNTKKSKRPNSHWRKMLLRYLKVMFLAKNNQ